MAVAATTCPFCNALVDVSAAGGRIVCPRCGEAFTPRSDAIRTDVPPEASAAAPATVFPPKPVRRNRVVGGIVVAVMLLAAAVGLIFALRSQEQRRAHDTRIPRKLGPQENDLTLLGYLPKRTNVVLGLNWPQLQESPAGRDFLERKVNLGRTAVRLKDLPNWLGLDDEDVRFVVVGLVVLPGELAPQFVLMVRSRYHIDLAAHRARLHNPRDVSGEAHLTQFDLPGLPPDLSGYLTYLDDQTLACSLFPENLKGLPEQPVEKFGNLDGELAGFLGKNVDLSGPIWLAGASDDWSKTSAGFLLGRLPEKERSTLAGVRQFGISVRQSDPGDANAPVTLKTVLHCRDETTAREAERWLLGGRRRWWRTPPADVSAEVDGLWVNYQRRLPLQELRLFSER
jgi:hypothetical protein